MGYISQHHKIYHRPYATKCTAPNQRFCHKSDDAKSIVNEYDCMDMNVIKVITVIILAYKYGINNIEQCGN